MKQFIKYPEIFLKSRKETPILNHHHWIFSGAIEKWPEKENFSNGGIVKILSNDGKILGYGYLNTRTDIAVRMLSFGEHDPIKTIEQNMKNAISFRSKFFQNKGKELNTNCYRLINSEGDLIPGLIVDQYDTTLVMQISTLGMEILKDMIISLLVKFLEPEQIYEKSDIPSRKYEGMKGFEGFVYAKKGYKQQNNFQVKENGLSFLVDLKDSQKTGLYLDQREMHKYIGELAKGCEVLNCFSYTGGFSIYALKGKAKKTTSVDISKSALLQAQENFKLNHLDAEFNDFIVADVFEYLENEKDLYDMIIVDPPAFVKSSKDIIKATQAYTKLNTLAFQRTKPGSIVLTSSCSHHIDNLLFRKIIFHAAKNSGREVKIISEHRLAPDHRINIYHPETEYLKSLLLFVD